MNLSKVPVVRYIWAWWRRAEADLKKPESLPPVIELFQEGEIIPLKGWNFVVAHRGAHGIVIAPVSFTAAKRKQLVAQVRERQRHVG